MTEDVNYYEILLNIENLLNKTSNYMPTKPNEYTDSELNAIRLEVLNYIYSVPLLKREFLDKINHFRSQTSKNDLKKEQEFFHFFYGQYSDNFLLTKYFSSVHAEYYILTLNSFGRLHLNDYFAQGYIVSVILKVLTDLYFFIDKQIQRNSTSQKSDLEPLLTLRENDVKTLAQQRKSRKEIANALGIEETTVQAHINSIGNKTGIKGLKQLQKSLL